VASEVVIVGGGFGGLFFGLGFAELGQLGHPAALRDPGGES
jgi:2-polyprenyl-6-methoxyphenol hydroxylase-like FAD-dependent oxidoreductase